VSNFQVMRRKPITIRSHRQLAPVCISAWTWRLS